MWPSKHVDLFKNVRWMHIERRIIEHAAIMPCRLAIITHCRAQSVRSRHVLIQGIAGDIESVE